MTHSTIGPATWFVTGASRGLGLDLLTQLLQRGDNVAATTRSIERLTTAVDGLDTTRLLPLQIDLADEQQVSDAVAATKDRFGGLDVVVNHAGYGFLIINVYSILGLTAFPGWGLYCAGKYALEGLTEFLAAEVADHGIEVNLVEPGYMRSVHDCLACRAPPWMPIPRSRDDRGAQGHARHPARRPSLGRGSDHRGRDHWHRTPAPDSRLGLPPLRRGLRPVTQLGDRCGPLARGDDRHHGGLTASWAKTGRPGQRS